MVLASRPGRSKRGSPGGFSLIEVLVTLAIVAMIALIATHQVSKMMKRVRLDGAARDVQAVAQRASNEMKTRGVATFLELSRVATGTPHWRVRLYADANADSQLQTATDTLISTLDLPSDISFSTGSLVAMTTVNWSGTNPADGSSRYLICDSLSRTEVPGPPIAQIAGPAVLEVTQRDMLVVGTVPPRLSPAIRYQVRIGPVWAVSLLRSVFNGSTWVNG